MDANTLAGILAIIAAVVGGAVTIITAINSMKRDVRDDIAKVHTDVNSRLTELVTATKLAARAEGVAAERANPGGQAPEILGAQPIIPPMSR